MKTKSSHAGDQNPLFDHQEESEQLSEGTLQPREVKPGEEPTQEIDWDKILEKINEKSNPQVFFWFTSLKLISQDDKSITLLAKTNFDKDWIENHYLDFISDTIIEIYNKDLDIKVVTPKVESSTPITKPNAKTRSHKRANIPFSGNLNPNYSFESFIVGPSNQFAHAALFAASQKPGKAYNPLFIYGESALEKLT